MTGSERRSTAALEGASAQYRREQLLQSEPVEALQLQVERLSGQLTRLIGCSGMLGVRCRGGWR